MARLSGIRSRIIQGISYVSLLTSYIFIHTEVAIEMLLQAKRSGGKNYFFNHCASWLLRGGHCLLGDFFKQVVRMTADWTLFAQYCSFIIPTVMRTACLISEIFTLSVIVEEASLWMLRAAVNNINISKQQLLPKAMCSLFLRLWRN